MALVGYKHCYQCVYLINLKLMRYNSLYRADYNVSKAANQMSDQLNSSSNMHQVNQLTTSLATKIPGLACYLLAIENCVGRWETSLSTVVLNSRDW